MNKEQSVHHMKKRRQQPFILQDICSQLYTKLQAASAVADNDSDNQQTLLRETQEALRLLETRVAVGKLGLKGDRQEVRVAVLLDLVRRKHHQQQLQQQGGSSSASVNSSSSNGGMDLKKVAKVVGMKHPQFQMLYNVVSNYFYEFQQPTTPTTSGTTRRGSSSSSLSRKRPTAATSTSLVNPPTSRRPKRTVDAPSLLSSSSSERLSILPDLTIRLALYLREPAYKVMQSTTAALDHLIQSTSSNMTSSAERRGHEYDLTRYWPAYQAAMLYHVVTTSSQSGTAKRSTTDPDDESHLALKLEDMAQASSAFSYLELKEKYKYIQQWVKEQQQKQKQQQEKQQKQEAKTKKKPTKTVGAPSGPETGTKVPKYDNNKEEAPTVLPDRDEQQSRRSLGAWRSSVLEAACAKFAKEPDPLHSAANHVLQKYGLLANAD